MIDLEQAIAEYHQQFQVILASGEDARTQRLRLDYRLANAKRGPWQHTVWLDNIAKNLDPHGPVQLIKETETQNYIEVESRFGSLLFAPFFGTIRNERYFIHKKGSERDEAPSCDPSLFTFEAEHVEPTLAELYPYALLVPTPLETRAFYELHLFLGEQPNDSPSWMSGIRHYGAPYIVRMPEEGGATAVEEVPFSPDSM